MNKETSLVVGTFDILHRGHIELFKFAASISNFVICATDSDRLVKIKKGETRPFNKQNDRIEMLRSIKYINDVVIFDTDEELASICWSILPDYRIIGSDYKNKEIIGKEFVKNQIIYFDRIDGYSTTDILNNNKKQPNEKSLEIIEQTLF